MLESNHRSKEARAEESPDARSSDPFEMRSIIPLLAIALVVIFAAIVLTRVLG